MLPEILRRVGGNSTVDVNKELLCCNLVLQFRYLLRSMECSNIIFQYFQVLLKDCSY